MFRATLLITAKKWKECKCLLTDKLWYIHTTEYSSAIKWNEVLLIHAKTQMDPVQNMSKLNPQQIKRIIHHD